MALAWPWAGAMMILLVFIIYFPALRSGFVWDDEVYVTENPLLTAPDGLKRIWLSLDSPSQYFPLTYTTFRLERSLWGLDPKGYHLVNILLHAANALLVWRLLERLRLPGAWLAAAFFALHPVHVESVAWITERKNVLSLFFFLLALLAWIEFVESRRGSSWRWYGLVLIFQALALFSKTTACTLPAALLLILWLKEKPIGWRRLAQVAPLVAMGLGMGLLTIWWERFHQGTQGRSYGLGWLESALLASRAIWFYAGKLVWPATLTFSYPRWTIARSDPLAYGWLLAGGGLCAAIYYLRRKVGRSVEVAVAFYVATLSPMLGFFVLATFQYSFVADHYQYVASIGPLALAAAGITTALNPFREKKRHLERALGGLLLLVLGVLSWRQASIYRNRETLWRDTLTKNPESWIAHDNLGAELMAGGRLEEAMDSFRRSIELNPEGSVAHNNYGVALLRSGRTDEAEREAREAIRLVPGLVAARLNLVEILRKRGELHEAVDAYEGILEVDAASVPGRIGLADTLGLLGRGDEAIPHYREVLRTRAHDAQLRMRLGRALIKQRDFASAESEFASILKTDPWNAKAMDGLGFALTMQGKMDEAGARFRESLRLDPKDAYTHLHYSMCLSAQGKVHEAASEYRKALELDHRISLPGR